MYVKVVEHCSPFGNSEKGGLDVLLEIVDYIKYPTQKLVTPVERQG